MLDVELPSDVAELLGRHDVPAGRLQLEITENTIMADPVRALDVLGRLGELGVQLSLDDFGTGYSSLAYLRRLPVQELKIDRSFISGLAREAGDEAIVRSVVELGHSLRLTVVAEGVEDERTFAKAGELGCDLVQGFYVARPMPAAELPSWLEGWEAERRSRMLIHDQGGMQWT